LKLAQKLRQTETAPNRTQHAPLPQTCHKTRTAFCPMPIGCSQRPARSPTAPALSQTYPARSWTALSTESNGAQRRNHQREHHALNSAELHNHGALQDQTALQAIW